MLGFWGWFLVIAVLWAIFEYDNLPKYKEKLLKFIEKNSKKNQ